MTLFRSKATKAALSCELRNLPVQVAVVASTYLVLLMFFAVSSGRGWAQRGSEQMAASARPLSFEVVSIRPSNPASGIRMEEAKTPDGYRATSQPLLFTILLAYFPQGNGYRSRDFILGAPPWIMDPYDINAKISDSDLAEWQKQGRQMDQEPMLVQMLRTMLAERFKLVVRRVPSDVDGYYLEVGKRGPRLGEGRPYESLPPDKHPIVKRFPDGGELTVGTQDEPRHMSFYNATMVDLAAQLSVMSTGHPVQDHTGITGRYNFTLYQRYPTDDSGAIVLSDPPIFYQGLETFGLRLEPHKITVDKIAIDHLERPTPN